MTQLGGLAGAIAAEAEARGIEPAAEGGRLIAAAAAAACRAGARRQGLDAAGGATGRGGEARHRRPR